MMTIVNNINRIEGMYFDHPNRAEPFIVISIFMFIMTTFGYL